MYKLIRRDEGEENNVFSQWYKGRPFVINGRSYDTAEQYMMSEKALLFNDLDMYQRIMKEPVISAGIFGYPLQEAWAIAVRACPDFVVQNQDYEIKIVFAVLDDSVMQEGRRQLALDLDERVYFLKGGLNGIS